MFVDQRVRPAFRMDYLGPFLRPRAVIGARLQGLRGAALSAVEDRELENLVALQEAAGLSVVSDGGLRRAFGHYDFLKGISGVEVIHGDPAGLGVATGDLPPVRLRCDGPLAFPAAHPYVAECRSLAAMTRATPKICLPSPASVLMRFAETQPVDAPEVLAQSPEVLAQSLVQVWRQVLWSLRAAGCRYVLFDEPNFAGLCRAPEGLLHTAADALARLLGDRPGDMSLGLWLNEGAARAPTEARDRVLRLIAGRVPFDAVFLAAPKGDWSALSIWREGVSRIFPILPVAAGDSSEDVGREIRSAALYLPLDRLGLAVTAESRGTDEAAHKRVLHLGAMTARRIWNEG